ncbi:MAG: hypothetical protein IIA09_00235 [Proteobacteria bacterium]|nr:hypothetical protein [Pseudomonadota bacterium]
MSDAKKKNKKKKDSFAVRMKRRGREFMSLGRILVNEPKRFPRALLNVLRRSFRTVWDARGGGLYACGYVLTFLWLEIRMLVDDILSAESISGFFGEQLFEILFRYLGESLQNMIAAFMWPVFVIQISPPWGLGILVTMFVVFPRWIKQPLEHWLFQGDQLPSSANTDE